MAKEIKEGSQLYNYIKDFPKNNVAGEMSVWMEKLARGEIDEEIFKKKMEELFEGIAPIMIMEIKSRVAKPGQFEESAKKTAVG